jgi:O-antigen/teichoic acid export membrane protein
VLPVDEFGVFSYAISLSGLGMTLVTAGLNALAVRHLVNSHEHGARIMTSLLVIRECFAIASYVILLLISLTAGSPQIVAAVAITMLSLFVRAVDVPDFWYQARLRARKTALLRTLAVLVWLGIKVTIAFLAPDLTLFLVLFVIEPLTVSIALMIMYLRDAHTQGFGRANLRFSATMVREASPLTLSAAADQINTRSDIVIIQAMMGSVEVALYSAAVKVSELLYFAPNAFMSGVFPVLLHAREAGDPDEYRRVIQRYLDRAFWAGAVVAIGLAALSTPIILILFGARFEDAVPVLTVLALLCPFVFMQSVASKWIVAEGLLWASFWRHSAGAVVNVALNLALIPQLGIIGAAYATAASYVVSTYLSFYIGRPTRPIAHQMSLALVWPVRVMVVRVLRRGPREGDSSS